MEFMSAREAADKWGISQRRVAVLCSENRIDNATMVGNMWIIPTTAEKPIDARSIRYIQNDGKKVKPFLKWAGGKGQLLSVIEKYYPFSDGKITKYAEPFVGGGAVLFDILSKYDLDEIYISDINAELINTYRIIQDDIDELILSQPDSGEQGLEIAETLVRSGAIDLVVVDSVAALVPQVELDGEMGDAQMGLQARLMSKALRKIAAELNKSECTIIFINQLREKIGVMFGNPETTTGGRALKFYSSVRIEIRRGEAIKQGTEIVGNKTNIKVVKNKVAPPFKTTQVDIIYGKGISRDGEVLDLAVENDIVEKSGAWYAYKGEKIGQGRENAKTYLTTHPDIMEEITQTIVKNIEETNNL